MAVSNTDRGVSRHYGPRKIRELVVSQGAKSVSGYLEKKRWLPGAQVGAKDFGRWIHVARGAQEMGKYIAT